MLSEFSYPIICTKNFVETVNFYEDFLNYSPVMETINYVLLKRNDWDNCYLAIMDAAHPRIPGQYKRDVSGVILNYPVEDVEKAHDDFYWEGLNIITGIEVTACHRKQFFIEDPSGMLIAVGENAMREYSNDDLRKVEEDSFMLFAV